MIYKDCDQCGCRYEPIRNTSKYCSSSCSQQAYRQRVLEKQEQEACEAARTAELELQRSLMEQYNAEADRVFAEKQAKQEAINAARLEHELKLEQERKQNQEKQRKIKDEKRKRDLATAEMKTKLYTIGGLVVFGALNYLSGSIQKQTKKSEIPPLTSKIEPE